LIVYKEKVPTNRNTFILVSCFQEVSYPLHACRYKDLISVDVSNESFQKLTFKPRKVRREAQSKGAKELPLPEGQVTPREPLLMDLYPTYLCSCCYWWV